MKQKQRNKTSYLEKKYYIQNICNISDLYIYIICIYYSIQKTYYVLRLQLVSLKSLQSVHYSHTHQHTWTHAGEHSHEHTFWSYRLQFPSNYPYRRTTTSFKRRKKNSHKGYLPLLLFRAGGSVWKDRQKVESWRQILSRNCLMFTLEARRGGQLDRVPRRSITARIQNIWASFFQTAFARFLPSYSRNSGWDSCWCRRSRDCGYNRTDRPSSGGHMIPGWRQLKSDRRERSQ